MLSTSSLACSRCALQLRRRRCASAAAAVDVLATFCGCSRNLNFKFVSCNLSESWLPFALFGQLRSVSPLHNSTSKQPRPAPHTARPPRPDPSTQPAQQSVNFCIHPVARFMGKRRITSKTSSASQPSKLTTLVLVENETGFLIGFFSRFFFFFLELLSCSFLFFFYIWLSFWNAVLLYFTLFWCILFLLQFGFNFYFYLFCYLIHRFRVVFCILA